MCLTGGPASCKNTPQKHMGGHHNLLFAGLKFKFSSGNGFSSIPNNSLTYEPSPLINPPPFG